MPPNKVHTKNASDMLRADDSEGQAEGRREGSGRRKAAARCARAMSTSSLSYTATHPESNSLQVSVYLKNEGLTSHDVFQIFPKA